MGKHSSSNGSGPFKRGGSDRQGSGLPRPAKRSSAGARRGTPIPKNTKPRVPDETYSLSDASSRRKGPLESAPARLRVERERRRSRTKRYAAIGAVALGVLIVTAGIGVFAYAKHIEKTMQKTIYKQEKVIAQLDKAKPMEPYNMLLVGFDRRPGETVYRTDSMLLARVDPKTKEVWLLSIPRDTKVTVPGHGTQKINNAYALGGPELTIETVEKFTDVSINHYMAINFEGFEKAVDAMGGVWVDVPQEINDIKADRSPGHRAAHVDAGYQLLDGEHALTFVRSRDYPDADITRMKNQQSFFMAIADQVAERTSMARIPGIVSGVAPYISTDMSLMEMLRTAQALRGAGSKRVYTSTIGGDWVSPYIVTDEEAKATLLAKFNAGEPFVKPKASEGDSSTPDAEETEAESTVDPAKVTVTVRNGAGIAGCAKQASSILKAQAFQVLDVGNANQFVYPETLVVFKGDRSAAELVAKALPPGTKLVESRGMYAYSTEVLVVVGRNWDVSKVPVAPIRTN